MVVKTYATLSATGLPTAFYNDDIYPAAEDGSRNAAIPAAAVEITEAQWKEFITNPGARRWDGSAVQPYTPPVAVMVPSSVYDYQFAGQAAAEGIITDDDAMKWVAQGITPQKLIDAVTANVTDPDRQKRVLLFLAGTTMFPRNHELTPLLAASFGKDTPDKLDAFFVAAGKR